MNQRSMEHRINQYVGADDNKLFVLIGKGDEGAFTLVYQKYYKLLYVLDYRYLLNRPLTEDAVQQVFTRLWEYRKHGTDKEL